EIDNYYKEHEIYESICQVSFGINHKFEKTPHTIFYFSKEEISTDPKTIIDYVVMHIHNFDPTLAPDGKTVVTFTLKASDFEFWQYLRTNNRTKYNEEKDRIVNIALEILEKFFPETRDKVEIRDVATPATYYRYTNNWQGSWEGWIPTPILTNKMKRTLPGLESFYMVSQWVNPGGGLPPALLAGRNVTQIICHEDKRVFTTK
ncbi:MAG: phytoene desaturase family protein, partial [Promethearchaeota archaeon]